MYGISLGKKYYYKSSGNISSAQIVNICLRFCKMFNYEKYLSEILNIVYLNLVNRALPCGVFILDMWGI